MANVAAGTVWNLPNYAGELLTASPEKTPFLSMIGGLTGGGLQTNNFEFPLNSNYVHESASQPAITETASLTAPTAISYVRAQEKNVSQIFQEQVSVSYERLANQGRLSGINTAGQANPVVSELDFQIATALKKIARDVEYTLINGSYQIATDASTANKTRGITEAATGAGTEIDASDGELDKSLLNELLRTMYNAGADFENSVIFVNGYQKEMLSTIFTKDGTLAPRDRNVGGYNIQTIETDYGRMGVVLNPFVQTDELVVVDVAKCAPVFQPVPEKGNFFYEMLSKTGAAESGQIFGKLGLAYGAGFYHGFIDSLATE
ncbi:MAG: DUF5309 family protein [Deltaproteobacteria bacterium]|nr:DUF5309 family protein [Deltaproteobacteria bacterium]